MDETREEVTARWMAEDREDDAYRAEFDAIGQPDINRFGVYMEGDSWDGEIECAARVCDDPHCPYTH